MHTDFVVLVVVQLAEVVLNAEGVGDANRGHGLLELVQVQLDVAVGILLADTLELLLERLQLRHAEGRVGHQLIQGLGGDGAASQKIQTRSQPCIVQCTDIVSTQELDNYGEHRIHAALPRLPAEKAAAETDWLSQYHSRVQKDRKKEDVRFKKYI